MISHLMRGASQPHLFLIGLGVMVPDHVTLQATRAMARCSQIYSLIQESPHLWMPPHKGRHIEVIDVRNWYVEGEVRIRNYNNVAQTIFRAVSPSESVGYVTYGNPMAYDSVAQNLVQLTIDAGLSVQVVPGVSSIDTVLCDLRLDMAPGIQVFDASWFVAFRIRPRIDVSLLLVQVGAFGSLRTHYTERRDGSSLQGLVRYCCELYPPTLSVALVRSSGDEGRLAQIRHVPLSKLVEVTGDELAGASLYIPPSQKELPELDPLARMEQT
jgi:uncharacterized protein YabN with tetrapyrrole methylase and pyrophosphatase domain